MSRIRLGIVGGGPGSFIGPVHVMAARLDGQFELVCGAFSRDPQRSRAAGSAQGVAPERCHASFEDMFAQEQARRGDGMQCVLIATPNDSHYEIATAALARGLHVLSEKPATRTVPEAEALERAVAVSKRIYGLTYAYSGYPLVREARAMIEAGRLGRIRKVLVEYLQGWLSERVEASGNAQAQWRTDPARAGLGGCLGDIGVHGFHLLEFVTGRTVVRVRADSSKIVHERELDDDFAALLRLDNDAPALMFASQAAAGEDNGLRLRIYGERGALDWRQQDPQRMTLRWPDRPTEILNAGTNNSYLSCAARAACRLPAGHPEGYIEALANIYRDMASAIGGDTNVSFLPSISAGVRGLRFVDTVLRSVRDSTGWVDMSR